MRYKNWLAAALAAAFFFQPSQSMAAENSCTCEERTGACSCERTIEKIAEEWENRCRCYVPADLDYAGKRDNMIGVSSTENGDETDTDDDGNGKEEKEKEKKSKKKKSRFVEILRDDSFIYYMDKKTSRYLNIPHLAKEKMIDVWIKLEPLEYAEGDYTYPAKFYLEHYLLRPKRQQIQFLAEIEVKGRPSNEAENSRYDGRKWEDLIPGSIEDAIFHAVMEHEGEIRDESKTNGTSIRDYIENTINVSL